MYRVLIYENRKINPLIWNISSPELERGAFLDLFNYLDKNLGFYPDFESLQEPPKPSLTLEQISKLPEGRTKKEAFKEHEEYKSGLTEFRELQLQKKLYEQSKKGDANAAKKLLDHRKNYEYENWTINDVLSKEA